MKRLRMIVTSVVVLAIVGGAFAFKTKAGHFCVKTGAAGNCTDIKKGFRITTDPLVTPIYRYYPAWDGTQTLCTQDANNSCQNEFRLIVD